jgi:hypothetical protein
MGLIDTQKALRDLRAVAKQHGLEVDVDRGNGRGSRYALNFQDPKSGERVHIVLPGGSEIVRGAERRAINNSSPLSSADVMAGRVLDLFVQVFQDATNEIAAVAKRSARSAIRRGDEIDAHLARIHALRSQSVS